MTQRQVVPSPRHRRGRSRWPAESRGGSRSLRTRSAGRWNGRPALHPRLRWRGQTPRRGQDRRPRVLLRRLRPRQLPSSPRTAYAGPAGPREGNLTLRDPVQRRPVRVRQPRRSGPGSAAWAGVPAAHLRPGRSGWATTKARGSPRVRRAPRPLAAPRGHRLGRPVDRHRRQGDWSGCDDRRLQTLSALSSASGCPPSRENWPWSATTP